MDARNHSLLRTIQSLVPEESTSDFDQASIDELKLREDHGSEMSSGPRRKESSLSEHDSQVYGMYCSVERAPSVSSEFEKARKDGATFRPIALPPASSTSDDLDQFFQPSAEAAPADADINEEFQRILEMSESTLSERREKYTRLARLSVDFVQMAKTYGRVIISEFFLPDDLKTIKPITHRLGGCAGGEKYIVRGILFKLAEDKSIGSTGRFVYGGTSQNAELAAKAAGHDLKGAVAYMSYATSNGRSAAGFDKTVIRVPMQALVDYCGFRLVAMPFLPLNGLVYGSADGGNTIAHSHPEVNDWMKQAAKHLHIAEHSVKGITLAAGGDIEVHTASDDRTYLLDLARTFPPEDPLVCSHLTVSGQSVFHRLLRAEFLQKLQRQGHPALSPDALSGWSIDQRDAQKHNKAVSEATRYLIEEVIPSFAAELDKQVGGKLATTLSDSKLPALGGDQALLNGDSSVDGDLRVLDGSEAGDIGSHAESVDSPPQFAVPVSKYIHKEGINVRHIGLLRSLTHSVIAREVLLVEIFARTMKNLLRGWLRTTMQKSSHSKPSSFDISQRVSCFLNLASGYHKGSAKFWEEHMRKGVIDRFGPIAFNESEMQDLYETAKVHLPAIIKYCVEMLGMGLTTKCQNDMGKFIERGSYNFNFSASDLVDMDMRVKYMSIGDLSLGKVLVDAALHEGTTQQAAMRLLDLSKTMFQSALRSDPNNTDTLQSELSIPALFAEIECNYSTADEIMLNQAEAVLDRKPLCILLCQALLRLWNNRKQAGRLIDRGGASSLKSLQRAADVVHQTQNNALILEIARIQSRRRDSVAAVGKMLISAISHQLGSLKLSADEIEKKTKDFVGLMCDASKAPDRGIGLYAFARIDMVTEIYSTLFPSCPVDGKHKELIDRAWHEALRQVCTDLLVSNEERKVNDSAIQSQLGRSSSMLCLLFDLDLVSLKERLLELQSSEDKFDSELLKLLISHKIIDGNNTLHWASLNGCTILVDELLKSKANPNAQASKGLFALYSSGKNGHVDIVRMLLDHKADPNLRDDLGKTALQISAYYGHLPVVSALLEARANPNVVNNVGWSALSKAAQGGSSEVVLQLINHAADVNAAPNKRRETALHQAAYFGFVEVAKVLIEHRADPDLPNHVGRTALELATKDDVRSYLGGKTVLRNDDDTHVRARALQQTTQPSNCCTVS